MLSLGYITIYSLQQPQTCPESKQMVVMMLYGALGIGIVWRWTSSSRVKGYSNNSSIIMLRRYRIRSWLFSTTTNRLWKVSGTFQLAFPQNKILSRSCMIKFNTCAVHMWYNRWYTFDDWKIHLLSCWQPLRVPTFQRGYSGRRWRNVIVHLMTLVRLLLNNRA